MRLPTLLVIYLLTVQCASVASILSSSSLWIGKAETSPAAFAEGGMVNRSRLEMFVRLNVTAFDGWAPVCVWTKDGKLR